MKSITCTSESYGRAHANTAAVIDKYLPRTGKRTWEGKASNACLDRLTRELRASATRATAVSMSQAKLDQPLITIGSRRQLGSEETTPSTSPHLSSFRAILQVVALFHDLGKASKMFQKKLAVSLRGEEGYPDRIRHELISTLIWDELFGDLCDEDLIGRLPYISGEDIDLAWSQRQEQMDDIAHDKISNADLAFLKDQTSLSFQIGMMILTHHRLPMTNKTYSRVDVDVYTFQDSPYEDGDSDVDAGTPYWHEAWFTRALTRSAEKLAVAPYGSGVELREAFMFADHYGSSQSEVRTITPADEHLANTKDNQAADSLSLHVRRVLSNVPRAVQMMFSHRETWPALHVEDLPEALRKPDRTSDRFGWQGQAAHRAAEICKNGGGFFGVLMAGTGSGKTRAAPVVMAHAVSADPDPARRAFRMTLGLGLRNLASQAARDYTDDLGFDKKDVSLFVGRVPLQFLKDENDDNPEGRGSQISVPGWLELEGSGQSIPEEGSPEEERWIRSLSLDTDRMVPGWAKKALKASNRPVPLLRLVKTPIALGTVDHIMAAAAYDRGRHLPQALRVSTSDLILDEIDQYDNEDIAALSRLVRRAGLAGRRVIIMSATLPKDLSVDLFNAYKSGWEVFADVSGAPSQVNALVCSNAANGVFGEEAVHDISELVSECSGHLVEDIHTRIHSQIGQISDPIEGWDDVMHIIDNGIRTLHDRHHNEIDGMNISIGAVRITRIKHTVAVAAQLPAGDIGDGRHRLKLCLHSNIPRAQREWVEMKLAKVLNRKTPDHAKHVMEFLEEVGALDRARAAGARDLEIVIICTAVIETGNDIDLDWAIHDNISMRSGVQLAGRVQRHRRVEVETPNVLVLSRCLIEVDEGRLAYPGVETPPPSATLVAQPRSCFPNGKSITEIAGGAMDGVISASPFLQEETDLPLLQAERILRRRFLCHNVMGAIGESALAALSRRPMVLRRFRRSDDRTIALFKDTDQYGTPHWMVDLSPKTADSNPMIATDQGITFSDHSGDEWLVPDLLDRAIADLENMRFAKNGTTIEFPDRNWTREVVPTIHVDTMLGAIAGEEAQIFLPFGRPVRRP